MQKVVSAEEMREIDRITTERYGIPSIILMENAAHAAASVITEKLGGSVRDKSFLILCGKGNNGGDGAALARILSILGAYVDVVLFGSIADTKGDARANFDILRSSELLVEDIHECDSREKWDDFFYGHDQDWDVVVDAIFGTGLNRPIDIWLMNVIHHINISNEGPCPVPRTAVSLDIPSGINSDISVPLGTTFQADLTITFSAPKPGNVLPPASSFNGELVIADIGTPGSHLAFDVFSDLYISEASEARQFLGQMEFKHDSYKNKRGHCLIIAGSENYSGAAILAANAAMRSGAGLVTLAVPKSLKESIAARLLPEIMMIGLSETENGAISEEAFDQIEPMLEKFHCISIGCGLSSKEEATRSFVRKVIESRKCPVLIDADGLNALSPFGINGGEKYPLVLTPHKGEMRRLLGLKDQEELGELPPLIRNFSKKHNVIMVLKGERVLIAEPGGNVIINPTGNPGLGKGGNGDTLAGILAGFIAQFCAVPKDENYIYPIKSNSPEIIKTLEAVVAGAYIAGLAGDIAKNAYGERVMTASDVRECLAEAFNQIEKSDD